MVKVKGSRLRSFNFEEKTINVQLDDPDKVQYQRYYIGDKQFLEMLDEGLIVFAPHMRLDFEYKQLKYKKVIFNMETLKQEAHATKHPTQYTVKLTPLGGAVPTVKYTFYALPMAWKEIERAYVKEAKKIKELGSSTAVDSVQAHVAALRLSPYPATLTDAHARVVVLNATLGAVYDNNTGGYDGLNIEFLVKVGAF